MPQLKTNHPILKEPIQALGVSHAFKQMATVNGFATLQDILDQADNVHKLPASGYRMLKELSDVLEANGLTHLLND